LKSLGLCVSGTGLAFITLPKRSVTVVGNRKIRYIQDLDARRKIIIIINRDPYNNN
jgi:hypothetical protein